MLANQSSVDEAADNWEFPSDAISEIARYCEANQTLIEMEADEESLNIESGLQHRVERLGATRSIGRSQCVDI